MRIFFLMLLAGVCVGAPVHRVPDRLWVAPSLFPTNGLVSYWSMDTISDTNVFDDFGSNDGAAINTPLFDSTYGKYLNGVDFNGANQHISIPFVSALTALTSGAFSVWFKVNDTIQSNQILLGIGKNTSTSPYFYITPQVIRFNEGGDTILSWDAQTTNEWHHLVITSDGSEYRTFVDAVEKTYNFGGVGNQGNQGWWFSDLSSIGCNRLSIGVLPRSSNYGYFDGSIDEVAIYNRALSSNEVSQIHNSGEGKFYTP